MNTIKKYSINNIPSLSKNIYSIKDLVYPSHKSSNPTSWPTTSPTTTASALKKIYSALSTTTIPTSLSNLPSPTSPKHIISVHYKTNNTSNSSNKTNNSLIKCGSSNQDNKPIGESPSFSVLSTIFLQNYPKSDTLTDSSWPTFSKTISQNHSSTTTANSTYVTSCS